MANRPTQKITAPVPRRHRFDSIGIKSTLKDTNSVAMPWVDMTEDVRLIREGWGERLPNNRWRINDRVYAREDGPKGTMFPESGDGIEQLTRSQFKALSIIRGYNEDTAAASFRLSNSPDISAEDIEFAQDLIRRATRP